MTGGCGGFADGCGGFADGCGGFADGCGGGGGGRGGSRGGGGRRGGREPLKISFFVEGTCIKVCTSVLRLPSWN